MKKFVSSFLALGLLTAPMSSVCFGEETETFVSESSESISYVDEDDNFSQSQEMELSQKLDQDTLKSEWTNLDNDSLKGQNKSDGNLEGTCNFEKKANIAEINKNIVNDSEKTSDNVKPQNKAQPTKRMSKKADQNKVTEKMKPKESLFSQVKAKTMDKMDEETKDQLKKAARITGTIALTIGVPLAFNYFTNIRPEKIKKKYNLCFDDAAEICKKKISSIETDLVKEKNSFAECKRLLAEQTCKDEYEAKEKAEKISKTLMIGKILSEVLKVILSA